MLKPISPRNPKAFRCLVIRMQSWYLAVTREGTDLGRSSPGKHTAKHSMQTWSSIPESIKSLMLERAEHEGTEERDISSRLSTSSILYKLSYT